MAEKDTMKKTKADKKQLDLRDEYIMKTGISFEEMDYYALSRQDRIQICLIKGILIFLSCFGINLLFIKSFQLPCSILLLGIFALFLSMFVAMFYYKRLFFNLGYIVLFIIFISLTLVMFMYANSGLNGIINILMEAVDKKLNLEGVRHYEELYENRFLTITSCLFLIMFLEVCFLNSLISEYMSGFGVFLVTFPILEICLYLNDTINWFYCIIPFIPIICCFILKHSRRYRLSLNHQELGFSIKKNRVEITGRIFRKTNKAMTVFGFGFAVVLLAASIIFTKMMPYSARNNHSAWKNRTDEDVAEFAMNGFSGYFNSYYATGGISNGKLGGVRQVNLDFETDMILSYVPYANESLYLRGFVGGRYKNNQWLTLSNYSELKASPYYFSEYTSIINRESNYLKERFDAGEENSSFAKMHIHNVDANPVFFYYPYYTIIEQADLSYRGGMQDVISGDIVTGKMPTSGDYDVSFYPLLKDSIATSANLSEKNQLLYEKFVYENYLDVPENMKPTLDKIIAEQHFGGDAFDIVDQLKDFFYRNYKYTLSPGKTPNKKDFVVYFLTKQKKGFCAHFASSGAMLLREMGIPTRYVEGYCVQMETVVDSDIKPGAKAEDWYSGTNLLKTAYNQSAYVLDVEVNDSSAHAWVEIYVKGYGWIPVELTTGREESGSEDDFWSNFTNLFDGNEEDSPLKDLPNQVKQFGIRSAVVVLILAVLFVIFTYIVRLVRVYFIYYKNSNSRLSNQFVLLNKILKKYKLTELGNIYHLKSIEIGTEFGLSEEDLKEYAGFVERASYGNEALSKNELNKATNIFRQYLKGIRTKLKGFRKLYFFIKY